MDKNDTPKTENSKEIAGTSNSNKTICLDHNNGHTNGINIDDPKFKEAQLFKTEEEKRAALLQSNLDSFHENYKDPNFALTEYTNQLVSKSTTTTAADFDTRVKTRKQEDNKRQKLRREEAVRYGGYKKVEVNRSPERGYLAPRVPCKRPNDTAEGNEEPVKRPNSASSPVAVPPAEKDNKNNEESNKDKIILTPD